MIEESKDTICGMPVFALRVFFIVLIGVGALMYAYGSGQKSVSPAPSPTVTATAYATVTASPEPAPTVTVTKKVEVTVTARPTQASRSVQRGSAWVEQVRACIMHRESRGDYKAIGVWIESLKDRATGAYQFLRSTWHNVTGLPGEARDYPPAVQDAAFYKLFANGAGRNHWYLRGATQCW